MSESRDVRKRKAVDLVAAHAVAGGEVLEVSCGSGHELALLRDRGFRVRGTNFTRYDECYAGIEVDHGVDILRGLPYADGSFDAVLLLDVIEHLRDHDRAVEELARVCRTGGIVVVMTPNTLKLSSRLHFLWTGFHKLKRSFIGFDVPHESAFAFHNYPPHLPVFLYQMVSRGLEIAEFTAALYKAKSFLFFALLYPFVRLATWRTVMHAEKYLAGSHAAPQLLSILTSRACLCGEFWFVVGRKASRSGEHTTRLPKWSQRYDRLEPGPAGPPAPSVPTGA
ncbi:MAG: class I SAM-dependent methyltransferase [Lentisphaeria bacterium]|nr:class I SAM-dependent methyltransferase [Lentisphaeria bacterium]